METENPTGITLINQHEMPISNIKVIHDMKAPELFGRVCALPGMEIYPVSTIQDVYKIALLAIE